MWVCQSSSVFLSEMAGYLCRAPRFHAPAKSAVKTVRFQGRRKVWGSGGISRFDGTHEREDAATGGEETARPDGFAGNRRHENGSWRGRFSFWRMTSPGRFSKSESSVKEPELGFAACFPCQVTCHGAVRSRISFRPTAKIRSPRDGRMVCVPVKLPNAGRTARCRPNQKLGTRSPLPNFSRSAIAGRMCPAKTWLPAISFGS